MLIAYILKDGKKETIAKKSGCDKEKFKEELIKQNIKFSGVDKIYTM